MAKKNHLRGTRPAIPEIAKVPKVTASEPSAPAPTVTPAASDAADVLSEVQSFLDRRQELAAKLAEEIAATERKLAELKKNAALLFPELPAANATKERKPKKVKAKSAGGRTNKEPGEQSSPTESNSENPLPEHD